MLTPRRFLPSLPLLIAFEVAARTGSITAAAKEIRLTQGAVSRQIKALEAQLDVQLFMRERQMIRLTPAGESYAREIREALRRISTASLNLRANPKGGTLNLAVLPTFAERWLAPRLAAFGSTHPHIVVNVMTRSAPVDFRHESFDGAVHFGTEGWEGLCMAALRRETIVPLCSPELRRQYGFAQPADLKNAPLLHLTTRPDAWERWFLFNGHDPESIHGPLFDQFSTMAQAAMTGLGLVLLPSFLFAAEIEAGTLVPALNLPMQSEESYFLTWPLNRSTYTPLLAFREWLLAETQKELGKLTFPEGMRS